MRALDLLRQHGIPAYFNALLFGPDLTYEEIEPELEFLQRQSDILFEIVEVVIYGRTALYEQLQSQGRLAGNYLAYDYSYSDVRLQRTHQMVTGMDTRHFGVYSPVKMAADLGFNLGILRVFYPGNETEEVAAEIERLTRRINENQIACIREAKRWATADAPVELCAEMLGQFAAGEDLGFYTELLELQNRMESIAAGASGAADAHRFRSYFRGGLVASGLIASLLTISMGDNYAEAPL